MLTALAACLAFEGTALGRAWLKENRAHGIRDAILLSVNLAPSDPKTLYVSSIDGFVFSTHDGGTTWTEATLIASVPPFFGSIRRPHHARSAGISAGDILGPANKVLSDAKKTSPMTYGLQDTFYFDYATLSNSFEYLQSGLVVSPYDPIRLPVVETPGKFGVRDSAGGSGHSDASKLGIALKTGAPRLKSMLRTAKMQSVGANLQQLLVEMGIEPTMVNQVAVAPWDPNLALAATSMGVFRTTDGGIGWTPVFAGTDRWEREGQAIVFDPTLQGRMFLGTQAGLFISLNSGETWNRVTGTPLESAFVGALEVLPGPRSSTWIYAGTSMGAFLSKNGGETWDWVYFETMEEANWVSSISADFGRPERVLLGTWDGIYSSQDAGKSWERAGGTLFTSTYVCKVVADSQERGHLIAATETNIWESRDDGLTWEIVYIDDGEWKVRSILPDVKDRDVWWVLTSAEVLRLTPYRKALPRKEREAAFRETLGKEPGQARVIDAAFRTFDVHPGRVAKYKKRSAWANFLPQVRIVGGYFSARSEARLDVPALHAYDYGDIFVRRTSIDSPYVAAMAFWDLRQMLFDFHEMSCGRVFAASLEATYNLKYQTARYFEERVRLMHTLIVEPPEEMTAYLDAGLRYRELTEHLNALTGGLYEDHLQQIRQGGIAWLRLPD